MKAADLLSSAAVRAFRRGDVPGGARLAERGTVLLPAGSLERAKLFAEWARGSSYVYDLDRAREVHREAIEAARTLGDRRLELHALVTNAMLSITDGSSRGLDLDERAVFAKGAIREFEALNDELGLATGSRLLALIYEARGRSTAAAQAWRRQIKQAQLVVNVFERPAFDDLAEELLQGPMPVSRAIQECEQLLALSPVTNRLTQTRIVGALAMLEAMANRFEQARSWVAKAQLIGDELDTPHLVVLTAVQVEMLAHDWAGAEAQLRALPDDHWFWRALRAILLANALYEQRRFSQLEDLIEEARASAIDGDLNLQGRCRMLEAKLRARRGDHAQAGKIARQGLELIAHTEWLDSQADALLDYAKVLRLANRSGDAATSAHKALALYERKGNVPSAKRARALLLDHKDTGAVVASSPDGSD